MSGPVTLSGAGGLTWNFAGSPAEGYSNTLFDTYFSGTGGSTNTAAASGDILVITAGATTTVSSGYKAVYDLTNGDTVTGSSGDPTYFLANNTYLQLGAADNIVFAAGDATVAAGAGSDTVYTGANGGVVLGGTGDLFFVGGTGSVSVMGGTGAETLHGSTGTAQTLLQAASGNSTLYGGSGSGASTVIGGTNVTEFAQGSGTTVMVAGTGQSLINGSAGTGKELIFTSPISTTGNALIALNNNADTVVGGSGSSTIVSGSGANVFGFVNGHAGGKVTIIGFNDKDNIAFGQYTNQPASLANLNSIVQSETLQGSSDVMTLVDGTQITFLGINHKLF